MTAATHAYQLMNAFTPKDMDKLRIAMGQPDPAYGEFFFDVLRKIIETDAAARLAKQKSGRSRQAAEKVKDFHVREWADEYLRPGMIVKVKAASATRWRFVTEVSKGSFTARHIALSPDPSTSKTPRVPAIRYRHYITDHLSDKIIGVLGVQDDVPKPMVFDGKTEIVPAVYAPIGNLIKQIKPF